MPFLTATDYEATIQTDILEMITDNTENIRTTSELRAQEMIESWLNHRYDVGSIFGATGTDRSPLIVMYMIDIVLYHIHSRISPMNIPEIRNLRYTDAIEWLKAVAKGSISPDLPYKSDSALETDGFLRLGSNERTTDLW